MWYFDNAATSYPKTPIVLDTLAHFFDEPIGSYGRSSDPHTLDVMTEVEELRTSLAEIALADMGEEAQAVFTKNATEAINLVIRGIGVQKEEVLISPMEHNTVTRPVHYLQGKGEPLVMPCLDNGSVDLEALGILLKEKGHALKLVCINHASNVNGVIQPLGEIFRLLNLYAPQAETLIDTSQSLPYLAVDVRADYVAFNAHKGYRSVPGAGALFIRHNTALPPLIRGGNGLRSVDQEDSTELPDRFEAGTQNLPALLCWARAMKSASPEIDDRGAFYEELRRIKGLNLFAESDLLFSVRLSNLSVSELHYRLQDKYGILTRSGVHCAPLAHRSIGTLPEGTVRFSPTPHLSKEGYNLIVRALYDLSKV